MPLTVNALPTSEAIEQCKQSDSSRGIQVGSRWRTRYRAAVGVRRHLARVGPQGRAIHREQVRQLKLNPISDEELKRAKDQLKGSLMLSLESSTARMSNLALESIGKLGPLECPRCD